MKQKVSYIKAISFQVLHDGSCSSYYVHQPNGCLFIYPSPYIEHHYVEGILKDLGTPQSHHLIIIGKGGGTNMYYTHTRHSLSFNFPFVLNQYKSYTLGCILYPGLTNYFTDKIYFATTFKVVK